MSTEENKAIIRRWIEVWNTGNLAPLDELIASDFHYHSAGFSAHPQSGPEWYKGHIADARRTYPDFHVEADDLLADGDKVIGRWSWGGSQLGDMSTSAGTKVAATGRKVATMAITISRIEGGKIAEEWWAQDRLGVLQQVGAIPTPARAKE